MSAPISPSLLDAFPLPDRRPLVLRQSPSRGRTQGRRYQAVELAEQALFASLLVGFLGMVYGFVGFFHW